MVRDGWVMYTNGNQANFWLSIYVLSLYVPSMCRKYAGSSAIVKSPNINVKTFKLLYSSGPPGVIKMNPKPYSRS